MPTLMEPELDQYGSSGNLAAIFSAGTRMWVHFVLFMEHIGVLKSGDQFIPRTRDILTSIYQHQCKQLCTTQALRPRGRVRFRPARCNVPFAQGLEALLSYD